MFQNINEDTIDYDSKNTSENKSKVNIFANVFTKDNIVLYLVSFMLSFVGLGGEFSIFSISMLAACISAGIPVLGIIVFSLIGNFLKFGVGGLLGYFITSLVMIVGLFIFKPRYNEQERNEKIKIGKNIFISILIIQIFKFMISGFTIYDALSSITLSMIALVFYKIFVNSIVVLKEFYKKRAFSVEEVIGASLLLAIIWRFKYLWFWNKEYFKYINCNDTWMEKWNTCWNYIRSYYWSNIRSYIRFRTYYDSSIRNLWYDSRNIK